MSAIVYDYYRVGKERLNVLNLLRETDDYPMLVLLGYQISEYLLKATAECCLSNPYYTRTSEIVGLHRSIEAFSDFEGIPLADLQFVSRFQTERMYDSNMQVSKEDASKVLDIVDELVKKIDAWREKTRLPVYKISTQKDCLVNIVKGV